MTATSTGADFDRFCPIATPLPIIAASASTQLPANILILVLDNSGFVPPPQGSCRAATALLSYRSLLLLSQGDGLAMHEERSTGRVYGQRLGLRAVVGAAAAHRSRASGKEQEHQQQPSIQLPAQAALDPERQQQQCQRDSRVRGDWGCSAR